MPYSHWQYFIAIEADLEHTTRYVEIAPDNFSTYSIEYTRIILSASSEIDVISKLLCQRINPAGSYENINQYRQCLFSHYSNFDSFEIMLPRYGLIRKPWEAWRTEQNPSWWRSYNNIKHERDKYFHKANLENAIDAVAGLFCLVLAYQYPNVLEMSPWPKLLDVEEGMKVAQVYK
jgi:hypothetical protein